MSREPHVPLLLWISTALLVHLGTSGGAQQVADVLDERAELRSFATEVRTRLRPSETFEVTFVDEARPEAPTDEPPADDPLAPPKPPKKDKPPPEPHAAAPEPKKPEPTKIVVVAPLVKAATPPPPPPPAADRRVAVRQHADPNQQDNPEAKLIADEANRVAEETAARITSHDRDDAEPTPGGHHAGPSPDPGNSDHDRVGESDDHAGDPTHAPGERGHVASTDVPLIQAQKATPPTPHSPRQTAAPPPEAAGGKGPASPDTMADDGATHRIDEPAPGAHGLGVTPGPGRARLPPPEPSPTSRLNLLGLGGSLTASGINLNLNALSVVAAVGQDQLTRERVADGERRKSAHRGSWQSSSFERWRAAIENYVASVKLGNTTALNTARVPFAGFLNAIHQRIHPIFADEFLGTLDGLPATHPMNAPKLLTRLEIVLDHDDGHVLRLGVVRTSGITAFDIAALDAVQRASPFGKPPSAIVSPDGRVYFHWEFHRDPVYACSTMNARPFMLSTPPAGSDPPPSPSKPGTPMLPLDPREHGPLQDPGTREGRNDLAPTRRRG